MCVCMVARRRHRTRADSSGQHTFAHTFTQQQQQQQHHAPAGVAGFKNGGFFHIYQCTLRSGFRINVRTHVNTQTIERFTRIHCPDRIVWIFFRDTHHRPLCTRLSLPFALLPPGTPALPTIPFTRPGLHPSTPLPYNTTPSAIPPPTRQP